MPTPPNIVLICVDQWRGDCLSIAGHPVVHTPFLDTMCLQGVRFRRAYSATPTCIPARVALFTGLSPRTHGRVGYEDGVPWDYSCTLASEFTRHGYQTQAVGKMHVFPERTQAGFQNVILHDGYLHFARRRDRDYGLVDDYTPWLRGRLGREADYFDHGVDCNSLVARPWDKPEDTHPTNWVAAQSIDFLRRRDPRKPFFLFMSFHRPHPPYDPPGWAFEQYANRAMPPVPVGDWQKILQPYRNDASPTAQVARVGADVLQRARAGYYGHMTHIDHQVDRFLEALNDYGLQNTYVCFVSDHGEMMGDHHMWRKGYPYEGSANVPLILRGPAAPGCAPGLPVRRGAVADAVVELRDIMPTLLDCAGLPVPSGVEGQSLLPLARGENPAWRTHLHGEHIIMGEQSQQWLTDGREKYVWFSGSGREQLFDLAQDPQELHDLAPGLATPAAAPRLAHWRGVLIQELAGREEGYTDGQRLIPGRPVRATLSHLRGR